MRNERTMSDKWMGNEWYMNVQWMIHECTMNVQCMYNEWQMIVQWMGNHKNKMSFLLMTWAINLANRCFPFKSKSSKWSDAQNFHAICN